MKKYGFYKVAAASLDLKVGNVSYNVRQLISTIKEAYDERVKVLVTPEMSLCGYTCADLFFQESLKNACTIGLCEIVSATKGMDMTVIVGAPIYNGMAVYNCAVVIKNGKFLGIVPKEYLANYGEFYEKRWFAEASSAKFDTVNICGSTVPFGKLLFKLADDLTMGVEICEDLWVSIPPSSKMTLNGANLIVNCSASNEIVAKAEYREALVKNQSARCICAYAYAGAGVKESTTDLVFSGETMICENGVFLAKGKRFQRKTAMIIGYIDVQRLNYQRRCNLSFKDNSVSTQNEYKTVVDVFEWTSDLSKFDRFVDPLPFVPSDTVLRRERCEEVLSIQGAALAKRLEHTKLDKCIVGISGGLDSTLALLASIKAMELLEKDNMNVIGVTLPGFGTTDRTYQNAIELMKSLGVTIMEIDITNACKAHMADIGHDSSIHDITYENTQARERTQVLMDLANKHGAILVGTGDLSEMALGWCTYNGDHMSMYGVNAGVPKTLVRYLVENVAENSDEKTCAVLKDILSTPVSPELLPPNEDGEIVQKTEEKIGAYELHDFFLYHFIRTGADRQKIRFLARKAFGEKYNKETIDEYLGIFFERFFANQFKRSCVPDSPKVGSVGLSPRGDWRMPSDADPYVWLDDNY